jgi:hypothetical protein
MIQMKERILTGWTLQRLVFLGLGLYLLISALLAQQWLGTILGGYFASMGLFGFGCAAGACGAPRSRNQVQSEPVNPEQLDIQFEEIKAK